MRTRAVLATGAVLVLAACAPTTPAVSSTPTAGSMARFLHVLHLALPESSDADDITIGRGVCIALGKGHSAQEIAAATQSTGINEANTRAIIEVSVVTFCPQFIVPVATWTS